MGLYDKAKTLSDEYAQVADQLAKPPDNCPALPSAELIPERVATEFDLAGTGFDLTQELREKCYQYR